MKITFDDNDNPDVRLYVKDVAALQLAQSIAERLHRHLQHDYLDRVAKGLTAILAEHKPRDQEISPDP